MLLLLLACTMRPPAAAAWPAGSGDAEAAAHTPDMTAAATARAGGTLTLAEAPAPAGPAGGDDELPVHVQRTCRARGEAQQTHLIKGGFGALLEAGGWVGGALGGTEVGAGQPHRPPCDSPTPTSPHAQRVLGGRAGGCGCPLRTGQS